MTKGEVIDLLIENQATVLMVVERVNARLIDPSVLFEDNIKAQWHDIIKKELLYELYNKGLTPDLFNDIISEDELAIFVEEVVKNE